MSRVTTSSPDAPLVPPSRGAVAPVPVVSVPVATAAAASPSRRFGPLGVVLCALGLVAVLSADFLFQLLTTELQGRARTLFTDYDVMAAAGAQASVGHLERAYDYQWMVRAAPSMGVPTGHWSPYTYPPTAALGFRILASVPDVAGFFLLQALGLALFFTGIARLSGGVPRLWLVASGVPIACFNLRSGQNGLVTAGLAAHAAALYADRRSVGAGLLAALVTFKPHLALGLPTLLAARREGRGLLAFIVVSVGLAALSVAEFGVEAWTAFAARNLADGTYPLARFSSTYAAAYGLGLRGSPAMAVHLVALLLATLAAALVLRRCGDRRHSVAVAFLWATFVSPYAYDYDMAILVVVAALSHDASLRVMGRETCANLLAVMLLTQFAGFVWWTFHGTGGVSALPLSALFVVLIGVVAKDRVTDPSSHSADDLPSNVT